MLLCREFRRFNRSFNTKIVRTRIVGSKIFHIIDPALSPGATEIRLRLEGLIHISEGPPDVVPVVHRQPLLGYHRR